jgi:hypothetical protein
VHKILTGIILSLKIAPAGEVQVPFTGATMVNPPAMALTFSSQILWNLRRMARPSFLTVGTSNSQSVLVMQYMTPL